MLTTMLVMQSKLTKSPPRKKLTGGGGMTCLPVVVPPLLADPNVSYVICY